MIYNDLRSQNMLHMITYDLEGFREDTGARLNSRQSGLVVHTHQLIKGFLEIDPELELSVTRTAARDAGNYHIITPTGERVRAQSVHTYFPFLDSEPGRVSKELVHEFYETQIHNPRNPLYISLAQQYGNTIQAAGSPNLLLQNANPVVGILKAEESGIMDALSFGPLHATVVIHDVEGYDSRLNYIADALSYSKLNMRFIAISEFICRHLVGRGISKNLINMIPNGIDIESFDRELEEARKEDAFEQVRIRNGLPAHQDMLLVAARRVRHKGHIDVVNAAAQLYSQGYLENSYVAFTGHTMTDARSSGFEDELRTLVTTKGLSEKIFFLDKLTLRETISCIHAAKLSILASTEPEGFGYANLESMLARRPVISSRLGGPLDYIFHKETGMLVEPHNPREIAHAISELLGNRMLYRHISVHGRNKAEEYGVQNMAQRYLRVIRS